MKFEEITRVIIGYAMRVHSALGKGFQEVIYQCALALEMQASDLQFMREMGAPIYYRNTGTTTRRMDFFVENEIMAGLKDIT